MKVSDIWECTDLVFNIIFIDCDNAFKDSWWIDELDTENFAFQAALECDVLEIDVKNDVLSVFISIDEFDAIQLTMMTNAVEPDFNSDYPTDLISGDITT